MDPVEGQASAGSPAPGDGRSAGLFAVRTECRCAGGRSLGSRGATVDVATDSTWADRSEGHPASPLSVRAPMMSTTAPMVRHQRLRAARIRLPKGKPTISANLHQPATAPLGQTPAPTALGERGELPEHVRPPRHVWGQIPDDQPRLTDHRACHHEAQVVGQLAGVLAAMASGAPPRRPVTRTTP